MHCIKITIMDAATAAADKKLSLPTETIVAGMAGQAVRSVACDAADAERSLAVETETPVKLPGVGSSVDNVPAARDRVTARLAVVMSAPETTIVTTPVAPFTLLTTATLPTATDGHPRAHVMVLPGAAAATRETK